MSVQMLDGDVILKLDPFSVRQSLGVPLSVRYGAITLRLILTSFTLNV